MPHSDLASSRGSMEQGQQPGVKNLLRSARKLAKLDALEKRFDHRMREMAILLGELKESLDRISIPQALDRFHDDQITLDNAKI